MQQGDRQTFWIQSGFLEVWIQRCGNGNVMYVLVF